MQTWRKIGIVSLVAVLFLTCCISIGSGTHIQGEYTQARNALGERLYTYLYMMTQKFREASLAGADVENTILPSMEAWFSLAVELNSYLTEAFGSRYTLLSAERIASISTALSQYKSAVRTGLNLTEAESNMTAVMNSLENLLSERYDSRMRLRSN